MAKQYNVAGKYHTFCADCGTKNRTNSNECKQCGYGDVENGVLFGVGNKKNVGKPAYTSDGESGVYERD